MSVHLLMSIFHGARLLRQLRRVNNLVVGTYVSFFKDLRLTKNIQMVDAAVRSGSSCPACRGDPCRK